jgi:hypothetical protein
VAREALVTEFARVATGLTAANLRPMVLPGATAVVPAHWTSARLRLTGGVASAPVAATLAPPRMLGHAPPSGESFVDPTLDWEHPAVSRQPMRIYGSFYEAEDPYDAELANPPRNGLRADYFDFLAGGLTDVPELAEMPPTLTRVDAAIDFPTDASFALPFDAETFGALWRGYLVVEIAGEYEFTAGSDDGARVRIAGTTVLEHRTLRPYAETSGRVRLEPGRHAIEVAFYENYVFASCRLFWRVPGATERRVVPAAAFEPPDEIADVDPPFVASVAPRHGRIGDEIVLRGSGFSATPALERVTFAGVPAEIVAASPTEIVVKVPIGASTGSLVVQVGPLSTRPTPFEVDSLLGLYGEYFLVGHELTDLPDLDALTPYFVRLDGPLDFTDDDLWQMPYEPDKFAARWFGYLFVPEEDEYEITLRSDDGAFVEIDGTRVVDLPGFHPPIERAQTVALGQGFHPIDLRFFENQGLARLSLYWRRRGEPTRVPIPRGFLFAPDALAVRTPPQVTSLEPASALAGNEILVHGAAFGTDARVVRVEFPGGVWSRPSFAGDDLLRVRVPHGAGSGPVRVHVGVQASGAVATRATGGQGPPDGAAEFTLAEPIGLLGEYFELAPGEAATAADLPALLASRSASVTRIDTRWRFGKRGDWGLPFADRDFAVRWTGALCVETTQRLQVALQSESSALLRVNGGNVVADIEPHTLRERYGGGRVPPGEHAIELYTLHRAGSDPRLHVFVTPFGRADHLELPPTWLRPRAPRR